ncbi:MAG: hypothetical protein MK481_05285 [SAR324 cluster bacterium]|nr:hypothetical protein [SAR324 cluster bacterium]
MEISTHKLVFKTDRYRDGDLADTREKFPNSYDPGTKVLSRKSGNSVTKH